MQTITFYSYKGGTGRSLALANAARYLARLEFKVVALDFDLEAPGLHYKFSAASDGAPLEVSTGAVDYLYRFVADGQLPASLQEFTVPVAVPGTDKPLIQITEMGGVAAALLADKVIAFVAPTFESLEGTRAVLRSLKRSRRDSGLGDLQMMVALSSLPQMAGSDSDRAWVERIRDVLNEEAEELADTLSCSDVFVLHSEAEMQLVESLRVGSDLSPDESVLLRDYLRLCCGGGIVLMRPMATMGGSTG